MYNINRLSDKNQVDWNILIYIGDFRRKYLEKCGGKYEDPIKKDLEALKDTTRESISSMEVKIIDEANNGKSGERSPFISRESAIRRLRDCLATRDCQVCQLILNPVLSNILILLIRNLLELVAIYLLMEWTQLRRYSEICGLYMMAKLLESKRENLRPLTSVLWLQIELCRTRFTN